jgi:hypothetical protein
MAWGLLYRNRGGRGASGTYQRVGFFLNLERVPQLITKLVHTAVLVPRYGAMPLAALNLQQHNAQSNTRPMYSRVRPTHMLQLGRLVTSAHFKFKIWR